MRKNRLYAEMALFLATFIWGGTFVINKIGLLDCTPITFIAVRFWIASVVFGVIFWKQIIKIDRTTFVKGTFLGILLFLGFAGQITGLQYTTASKSGFITGMLVVFTPISQLLIERKSPTKGNIIGVILVTIGLWFLTSPEGAGFNKGDLMTLCAAFVWGPYIVYLDVFTKAHDVKQITFIQVLMTALLASMIVPFAETPTIHWTGNYVWSLLYTAILATIITTYIQAQYQKETTPTRAAIIYSAEPVVSAILAFFVLYEIIGLLGIFGGVLITTGVLVSELTGRTETGLQ